MINYGPLLKYQLNKEYKNLIEVTLTELKDVFSKNL